MAKKEKKPVHHVQMTEGKRAIIQQLLQEYDIETAEDIQDALKDLLGGTIKEMMEAEMDEHLGYEKSERIDRSEQTDYRNGTKRKQVNSSYGSMTIDVPQDRNSTFEPQVVKKRQKDISDIDQKIISMYAKGMTTRQISDTLMDIYGFEASEGFISDVTDKLLPQIEEWQNRPLDEIYPVLFIDAIHYSVRLPMLVRGMKSDAVWAMQQLLMARGYELPAHGADGNFGEETVEALMRYQENMNLVPDGKCGPETWSALLGLTGVG